MKRTLLSVAVLATLFATSCNNSAMVPVQSQANEASILFSARMAAGLVGLPSSTISSEVKNYLDQNASGSTLIRVKKMYQPGTTTFWGTKVTVLQNGVPVDYFFDANGAPTTRPAGPRGEVVTRLTASQLPASVNSYLNQTYAGYQFIVAESMQITGTAQEYRVQILTNNQRVNVHFDGSGTFRDAHTAPGTSTTAHSVSYVSRNNLPDAIKNALSSTYASYTYAWAEQHVHDGTTTYDVKLVSENRPFVLHFDTAGSLVAPAGPGGPGPKQGGPTPPAGGTTPPSASANHRFILDAAQLPSAISSYLQANFAGYTFLAADLHTPPTASSGEYKVDLAVGEQLYKLRFTASGELLAAEARE